MSYYGSKQFSTLTVTKRKLASGQQVMLSGVGSGHAAHAYRARGVGEHELKEVYLLEDDRGKILLTGATSCVVISLRSLDGTPITSSSLVDVNDSYTLQPKAHAIVLEGILKCGEDVYDAADNIHLIDSREEGVVVEGKAKILEFFR